MSKLENEQLFTVKEVATFLKVHEITVRRHLESGKLKGFKLSSNRWRISKADLEEYLQARRDER